jgi:hypothetical protein
MTAPAWPRQYRIILRGECRQLLAGLPGDVSVQAGPGWTCVMAAVRDESELYGLLDRFQEFALHIISLNELGTAAGPAGGIPAGSTAGRGAGRVAR